MLVHLTPVAFAEDGIGNQIVFIDTVFQAAQLGEVRYILSFLLCSNHNFTRAI